MVNQQVLDRIDALIVKGERALTSAEPSRTIDRGGRSRAPSAITSHSPVRKGDWTEWRSQSLNFLDQVIGESEAYRTLFETYSQAPDVGSIQGGLGVLKAVREDIASGHLARLSELVRANVFSSFLEQAEYLLAEGYKDAAAVLGGGVLEEHLRLLWIKSNIPTSVAGKPKKADTMNAELVGANVYDRNQQKIVTGWLAIRNSAAHGKYAEYTKGQVDQFLAGLRDFVLRFPA